MTSFDHQPSVLLARLLAVAPELPFPVTTRPMMGGYVGYADGKVFVSISRGGFGVKLTPPDQDKLLVRPGSAGMQHGPADPVSKSYVILSSADLANDEVLIEWLLRAAKTAAPPNRKPRS